jgi:hypothetical protein
MGKQKTEKISQKDKKKEKKKSSQAISKKKKPQLPAQRKRRFKQHTQSSSKKVEEKKKHKIPKIKRKAKNEDYEDDIEIEREIFDKEGFYQISDNVIILIPPFLFILS